MGRGSGLWGSQLDPSRAALRGRAGNDNGRHTEVIRRSDADASTDIMRKSNVMGESQITGPFGQMGVDSANTRAAGNPCHKGNRGDPSLSPISSPTSASAVGRGRYVPADSRPRSAAQHASTQIPNKAPALSYSTGEAGGSSTAAPDAR